MKTELRRRDVNNFGAFDVEYVSINQHKNIFIIIFIMCGLLESNKLAYIHFSVRVKEKYTKIFFLPFLVLFSKYSLRMRWTHVYICVN